MTQAATITADVLVLGSGLAGMLTAIEIASSGASVVVASKGMLADSNSSKAQGGVAAVTPATSLDSPALHLSDTIQSGAGLCDHEVARGIIDEGAALIRRLRDLGVRFDIGLSGTLALCREGGHSQPRVLHSKDTTGKAIIQALIDRVSTHPKILALQNTIAVDLVIRDGHCQGAHVLFNNRPTLVVAGQVVLATGGVGQVFARTTNPEVATGDGIALAFRAGARVMDMEFVQFHPTALCRPNTPAFLISEAVRGAGAVLLDNLGQRFAKRFHEDGELATRDIVARGIATVIKEQGADCVWLDLRPIGPAALESRFPNIVRQCRKFAVDPVLQPVPVSPAAHYFMGGVWTDAIGATTIPGLYAIGECASIGLHGANRLASNSLLEAGVMAMRLSRHLTSRGVSPPLSSLAEAVEATPLTVADDLARLRARMYDAAGIVRDAEGLNKLSLDLKLMEVRAMADTRSVVESASMLCVAQLIARAALERRESRGAHYRLDFPSADDRQFLRRLWLTRSESGWVEVKGAQPVAAPAVAAFAR